MEQIAWTKAARKHNMSRKRSRYVVEHPRYRGTLPGRPDPRELFLGVDEQGVELEVMGVVLTGGVRLVIHAMKLRDKYRHYLEEAGPE